MAEQNNSETTEKLTIKIPLIRIPILGKNKKPLKMDNNEVAYIRDDYNGLISLFNYFDSRLHEIKDYKMLIKIRDKIQNCWIEDLDELELSLDEGEFLKRYLQEINQKDAKDKQLQQFEIRTLCGVLEKLQ